MKTQPTTAEQLRAYFGDEELDAVPHIADLQSDIASLRSRLKTVPVRDGALRWLLEKDLAATIGVLHRARLRIITGGV